MSKKLKASGRRYSVYSGGQLRVAHYKHTGRVLPKTSTSYPILVMILLCVGVFLASWTTMANADFPGPVTNSYTLTVRVPGPPPSVPATITAPTTGQTFNATPIAVTGECPTGTYESITRNGVFSGISLCNQDGTYNIQTSLFQGVNTIVVQDFSATDVPGPVSQSITIDYEPPAPPVISTSGGGTTSTTPSSGNTIKSSTATSQAEPLLFKTLFRYKGYYVGQPTDWQVDLEGGTPPYAVSVDWGDGTHGLISRSSSGSFDLSHIYKKAGGYKGSYVISLTASDANNQQTYLQLITIINNYPTTASTTHKNSGGNLLSGQINSTPTSTIERYVWSSYGLLILMLSSFWLGERQERRILLKRLKPRLKHHPHKA